MLSPEAQDATKSLRGPHLESEPRWYLLIIPDTGKPDLSRHHSFEAMRQAAKDAIVLRSNEAIFAFYGVLAPLAVDENNSQLYYVVHPDGQAFPLFDVASSLRVFEDGCLYEDDDDDDDDEEIVEVEEEQEVTEYTEEPAADPQSPDPDDEGPVAEVPGDVEPVEPSDEPEVEYP